MEVAVLATANTGLQEVDVFHFGRAIGETRNDPANAHVNAADRFIARSNPTCFLNALSLITIYADSAVTVSAIDEITYEE